MLQNSWVVKSVLDVCAPVFWIWTRLRGRIKRKVSGWWRRKDQVWLIWTQTPDLWSITVITAWSVSFCHVVIFSSMKSSCSFHHFSVNLVELLNLKYSNATFVLKMSLSNWIILSFSLCLCSSVWWRWMFDMVFRRLEAEMLRLEKQEHSAVCVRHSPYPNMCSCLLYHVTILSELKIIFKPHFISLKAWILYSLSSFSGFFMFAVL